MIVRHLIRFPFRAVVTVLGVALAVGALIASLFALDSIEYMIDEGFFRAQRQDIVLTFAEPRSLAALATVAQLPGVILAEPVRTVPVRLRHGHLARRAAITGTVAGATLTQLNAQGAAVMPMPEEGLVLSRALARRLDATLGAPVTVEVLEGRRAAVEVPIAAISEEHIGLSARMSVSALSRLLMEAPSLTGANVLLDQAQAEAFHRAVKRTPLVAGVSNRRTAVASFRATVAETLATTLTIYFVFGGAIALGVLYNSMRVTLSERGRELASLRVIGFTAAEAAYVLIGQIVVLSLAALPTGCLIGYGLAAAIATMLETDLFRVPLVVERSTYGFAMLTVVAAAVLAGLIGALRVRRLNLIGVLKTRE